LQVVAKEEDTIVPRCRDHIERVHGTLVQRETEFEVLEKEALAVVADLRQKNERNVGVVDDRVRPLPVADTEVDVQLAHDHAIGRRRSAARLSGRRLPNARKQRGQKQGYERAHGASIIPDAPGASVKRSEERRVGKEGRCGWARWDGSRN